MKKYLIGILSFICLMLIVTTKSSDVDAFNSTFSVLVPKSIVTGGSIILAEADIDDYEVIKIDIPSAVSLSNEDFSKTVDCPISLDRTSFIKADFDSDLNTSNITIDDSEVSAGKWSGDFAVNIYISEVPLEDALDDWEYTIDDTIGKIYLNKYIGTKTDIKVYGVYQLNGKIYDTVLQGYKAFVSYTYLPTIFDKDKPVNRSNITSIQFNKGVVSTFSNSMFADCVNLTNIDLSNVKFSNIDSLTNMFRGCKSLQKVDFGSSFDTSNNTSLDNTFAGCENLEEVLNADYWITNNVTSLNRTFAECKKLKDISFVTNWSLINNTSLDHTFYNCYLVSDFNPVKNWYVNNVTTMKGMFWGTSSLREIDLSSWVTSSLTNLNHMFYCSGIENIDLTNFDFTHCKELAAVFMSCENLQTANLANTDVSNITSFWGLFYLAKKLQSVDITGWNAPKCSNIDIMFCQTYSLVDIKGIETLLARDEYVVTNFRMAFDSTALSSLDLSAWRAILDENCYRVFANCRNLIDLDVSGLDSSNATNMTCMFYGCNNLEHIVGVENWDVSNVQSFNSMFYNCNNLQSLDLHNWYTPNVINFINNKERKEGGFYYMFFMCKSLSYLDISNFINDNHATCMFMLAGCWNLGAVDLDMSKFNFRDAVHVAVKDNQETVSSGITNIFYSTTANLFVMDEDYDIICTEVEAERQLAIKEGYPNVIYVLVNKKSN